MKLLVVSQQLHVCSTAFETILKLDLVLYDQGLTLVVDLGWKFRRDGMVGSCVLHNETFVASDAGEDFRLLD